MKILFVAHSGKISGGANRILLQMMKLLRSEYGVQPAVLIPEADSEMQKACEEAGIPVYTDRYFGCCTVYRKEAKDVLRLLKMLFAPAVDYLRSPKLDERLPKDFDLIYTNDRMVIAGAYLAKRRGVPHVWHARCFGRANQNHFPPFWYRRMERLSDRIITISSSLYREFEPHICDKKKLVMIHDGIDTDHYSVKERKAHPRFSFLLTGRLVPPKGQLDAIRAMDILVNRHHENAALYLAGKTPDYQSKDYEQSLRKLIEQLKLTQHVHLLGEVADITALRSEMDAELMCAWSEAFGLVSAEAMCAELPVIGTRAGGTQEIIDENVTGLLCEAKNPEDLAEKMLELCRNHQRAEQLGQEGRRRVLEMFSIETCIQRIYRTIRDCI